RIITHVRLDDELEANYQHAVETIEHLRSCLQGTALPVAPPSLTARKFASTEAGGTIGESAASDPPFLTSRARFEAMVERAKEYIHAGDIFQVVLSQRFARPVQTQPFSVYRALRSVNPSPYLYYLDLGEVTVVGASPELLVRVEDGEVIIR